MVLKSIESPTREALKPAMKGHIIKKTAPKGTYKKAK